MIYDQDPRSSLAETRNPILRLPAAKKLQNLPPEAREALRLVLLEMRFDCLANADKCWKKHKAPMAAYWKAVGVYAGHISRTLRK